MPVNIPNNTTITKLQNSRHGLKRTHTSNARSIFATIAIQKNESEQILGDVVEQYKFQKFFFR